MAQLYKKSEIVIALAEFASAGTYNDVTVTQMRNINTLYVAVAVLINELEAEEREADENEQTIIQGELVEEGEDNE